MSRRQQIVVALVLLAACVLPFAVSDYRTFQFTLAIVYAIALLGLNNRGYSRYLAGDLDAAERDFRAALTVDPGYEKAWQNLGLVFARRGDYPLAVATLGRVVSKHVAANDVGYIAMLSGDYATAEQLFADAIRLSPRYYQTADENTAELRRRRAAVSAAAH